MRKVELGIGNGMNNGLWPDCVAEEAQETES